MKYKQKLQEEIKMLSRTDGCAVRYVDGVPFVSYNGDPLFGHYLPDTGEAAVRLANSLAEMEASGVKLLDYRSVLQLASLRRMGYGVRHERAVDKMASAYKQARTDYLDHNYSGVYIPESWEHAAVSLRLDSDADTCRHEAVRTVFFEALSHVQHFDCVDRENYVEGEAIPWAYDVE